MAACAMGAYAALKTGVHTPYIIGILPLSVIGYSMWLASTDPNVRCA
jgi:hypothetical protein